jgi:quercetin dioxygenase-like cupin family protein
MPNDILQIARRIKELREISGISMETLAKEFSIPIDLYKKYESGESDIPIGFLYQVSGKFNVELTAIITGEEPKLKIYSVMRKQSAPSIERRKEYKYQDLGYNFVNKKAEVFIVTAEPKNDKEPINAYAHPGQEFNYVLEGSIKIYLNDQEIILEEGDSIFFDSGYKHAMRSLNNKSAKFLAFII